MWPGWVKCSPVPEKCKDNCMFFTQKRGTQLEHFPFFLFLSFGILVKYYNLELSETTVNTLKNESSL